MTVDPKEPQRREMCLPCAAVSKPNPETLSPDNWGKGGAAALTSSTGCLDGESLPRENSL